MHRYCYICNNPLVFEVYVCHAHESDPETRGLYQYVLANPECDATQRGPRYSPDASIGNLRARLVDPDLIMDRGL